MYSRFSTTFNEVLLVNLVNKVLKLQFIKFSILVSANQSNVLTLLEIVKFLKVFNLLQPLKNPCIDIIVLGTV